MLFVSTIKSQRILLLDKKNIYFCVLTNQIRIIFNLVTFDIIILSTFKKLFACSIA